MKTTSLGQKAEEAVAHLLIKNGYKMLDTNWRTRYCEIDIIAAKDKVVYFIEVKYRSSADQGDGLAYITPEKQRQVRFAANLWTSQNNYEGDWRIMAAAVAGPGYEKIDIVNID
ncbi:MAG: YraN family protein [Candidatus Saccharimonadales bacterium]